MGTLAFSLSKEWEGLRRHELDGESVSVCFVKGGVCHADHDGSSWTQTGDAISAVHAPWTVQYCDTTTVTAKRFELRKHQMYFDETSKG